MKSVFTMVLCTVVCYYGYGQAYPDRHSTSSKYAWTSCQMSASPNKNRAESHWIMYDLGSNYELGKSTVWNNNTPGKTKNGLHQVVIDYSKDGNAWTELGQFDFEEGAGSTIYQGDVGPDFGKVKARFVLITALSNHGGECYSLSELKINAKPTQTTATIDEALNVSLSVSPNPATDMVTVKLSSITDDMYYQLTDVSGKILRRSNVNTTAFKIDVSELTSGAYTLTLYTSEGTTSKIISVITQ